MFCLPVKSLVRTTCSLPDSGAGSVLKVLLPIIITPARLVVEKKSFLSSRELQSTRCAEFRASLPSRVRAATSVTFIQIQSTASQQHERQYVSLPTLPRLSKL